MASWYSNILTKTSSQISNLRTTLLSSEADGDTEDDTHVCRVLRDYYTEKGRPFPQWLPPDPKAPPPTQPLYAQSSASQIGSRYGGMGQPGAAGSQPSGLSSLWGDSGGQQQQQAPAPQSLRVGRGGPPAPMQQKGGREDVMARPLPSQRSGSYQTAGSNASPAPAPAGGASSAQDRLRQRFRGGGNSRGSSPSQGSQSPFQAPAGAAGYDAGGGGGGAGAPYVASSAPWSTGDDPYAGGSGGYQKPPPPGPSRRQGLPSGPRGYR